VITGTHTVLYATDPAAARAFLRDVIGLANVDAGDGWLIFKLPPHELGVHPTDPGTDGTHELFLLCDDVHATVAELTEKGVEFTSEVAERRFGSMVKFKVPGAGEMSLYQPKHPTAYDLTD
jgi:catechol 2,3-dioxygenase-like lactoylglutathione lyase family enzyme